MNIKKVIWFSINIFILIYFSYLHIAIHHDTTIPFIYLILLFTFPLGFIVSYILYFLSFLLQFIGEDSPYLVIDSIIIPWCFFLLVGYVEWFILIPKIKLYFKNKKP